MAFSTKFDVWHHHAISVLPENWWFAIASLMAFGKTPPNKSCCRSATWRWLSTSAKPAKLLENSWRPWPTWSTGLARLVETWTSCPLAVTAVYVCPLVSVYHQIFQARMHSALSGLTGIACIVDHILILRSARHEFTNYQCVSVMLSLSSGVLKQLPHGTKTRQAMSCIGFRQSEILFIQLTHMM